MWHTWQTWRKNNGWGSNRKKSADRCCMIFQKRMAVGHQQLEHEKTEKMDTWGNSIKNLLYSRRLMNYDDALHRWWLPRVIISRSSVNCVRQYCTALCNGGCRMMPSVHHAWNYESRSEAHRNIKFWGIIPLHACNWHHHFWAERSMFKVMWARCYFKLVTLY